MLSRAFVVAGGLGTIQQVQHGLEHVERSMSALCAEADEPGFEALAELRSEIRRARLIDERPLIIGAGEGSTGTKTIHAILAKRFRLRVLLGWDSLTPQVSTDPDLMLRKPLARLLAGYDAVIDTPVAQIFPFLLATFPNARVIHTYRSSRSWVKTRTAEHFNTPLPLSSLYAPLLDVWPMKEMWRSRGVVNSILAANETFRNRSEYPALTVGRARGNSLALATAYTAYNMVVRCLVPPSQYIGVNVVRGDACRADFVASLARFFNRTATSEAPWQEAASTAHRDDHSCSRLPSAVRRHS